MTKIDISNRTTPLVSVIIPTYNRGSLLCRAIKSILAQTHTNLEVLICDDGSTDNSLELVTAIKDSRITWLPGTNSGGPATPRNRGISQAQGTYLAFCDSDDLWLPKKIQKQLAYLSSTELDAVATNASIIKDDIIANATIFPTTPTRYYTFNDLLQGNPIICSSLLVKSLTLKRLRGFPCQKAYRAIEDYALWQALTMLTPIGYLAEPLTIYQDEAATSIRGQYTHGESRKKRLILRFTLIKALRLAPTGLPYAAQIIFMSIAVRIRRIIAKGTL